MLFFSFINFALRLSALQKFPCPCDEITFNLNVKKVPARFHDSLLLLICVEDTSNDCLDIMGKMFIYGFFLFGDCKFAIFPSRITSLGVINVGQR